MKQIKSYMKNAAKTILHSSWFVIVSAIITIGTFASFLICCLLQHVGVLDSNQAWVVVWLFSALSLTAIFSFIMWAAIVIESCCRIDEE